MKIIYHNQREQSPEFSVVMSLTQKRRVGQNLADIFPNFFKGATK